MRVGRYTCSDFLARSISELHFYFLAQKVFELNSILFLEIPECPNQILTTGRNSHALDKNIARPVNDSEITN